jgi:phosphate transport system protein
MGITKIVTDLERIGDEAKKIAKGARRVHEQGQLTLPRANDVRHIADEAIAMLRQALDCFARLDADKAAAVIHADVKVDAEFKALVRQLITYMMEDPRTITTAIDIVWICRSVERIGDHAKNIAEHVVYIAEGRDIRHLGKEA